MKKKKSVSLQAQYEHFIYIYFFIDRLIREFAILRNGHFELSVWANIKASQLKRDLS